MRKLNKFKVNVFYNENGEFLQKIIDDLFISYVKNKVEEKCNSNKNELTYIE